MLPAPREGPAEVPFFIENTPLGGLTFEINPSTYDHTASRDVELVQVASGVPLVRTPLYDNTIRTMTFDTVTSNFYTQLKHYSDLTADGGLTQASFTDGAEANFTSAPIKVLKVHGQADTGLNGSGLVYHDVSVEFIRDL